MKLRKNKLFSLALSLCFLAPAAQAATEYAECIGCSSNQMKNMAENIAVSFGPGTYWIQVGDVLYDILRKYKVTYVIEPGMTRLFAAEKTPTSTDISIWSEFHSLVIMQQIYDIDIPASVVHSFHDEVVFSATSVYLRSLARFNSVWVALRRPIVTVTWSDGTSAKFQYRDMRGDTAAFVYIPGSAKDADGNPIDFKESEPDSSPLTDESGFTTSVTDLGDFLDDAFSWGVPIYIVGNETLPGCGTWTCDENSCVLTMC